MKRGYAILIVAFLGGSVALSDQFLIEEAAVNRISIQQDGKTLAVNGAAVDATPPDVLLLTHNRRDIVEAARTSVAKTTTVYAPEASREYLENPGQFWQNWWTERFDYYGQQVTRIPVSPFPAKIYLNDGDEFEWQGMTIRFITLPGYTKDGGGYVFQFADGRKEIVIGDLLLQGGKVPDLFSFQNAIPEAKIGNYHGYLGRLSAWLDSLEKLRREKPDTLIPARGQPIRDPQNTIDTAMKQARDIYRNYLSTNALHWYFGEERMSKAAELVLGEDHGVKGMPLAQHIDLPDWCHHIGTTKLLISESGKAFALDVGGRHQFETLFKYQNGELFTTLDGIFVTHTHNDHSAFVADAEKEFGCSIYGTESVCDVLTEPGKWFYPGVPNKPVGEMVRVKDGESMQWQEFRFTFRDFPGQMLPHGALLVEKPGHDPVFFIGDSFSPSGIDDYCMMNRNLMRDDQGYEKCFAIVRSLPEQCWLVNQHINHLFRFSTSELDFLQSRYQQRRRMISQMVAADDPNYGIDEQWAWVFPYGQTARPGETVRAKLRITNYSPKKRTFSVTWHGGEEMLFANPKQSLTLDAGASGFLRTDLQVSSDVGDGVHVYTASIASGEDMDFPHWVEGMIKVEP